MSVHLILRVGCLQVRLQRGARGVHIAEEAVRVLPRGVQRPLVRVLHVCSDSDRHSITGHLRLT